MADRSAPAAQTFRFNPISNRLQRLGCFTIQKWSARRELHSQGCWVLNPDRLLFRLNHEPMVPLRGFAPPLTGF